MVSRKTRLERENHVSTEKGASIRKVSAGLKKAKTKMKHAKMAKSIENKKLITDAYVFDETDYLISGSSILSPTLSSSNTVTTSTTKSTMRNKQRECGVRKASFVKPNTSKSKTDNVKRCNNSKQLKKNNLQSENGLSKTQQTVLIKKTSTPLALLTPENSDNKPKYCFLDCKIVMPKLNLDLTVTPILPICTPSLTHLSSKCSKSVSFSDVPCLKQNDSRETPKHPEMKSVTQSTGMRDKELFDAVADVRDLKLKRKYSKMCVMSPKQTTQEGPKSGSGRVTLPRKATTNQNKPDTHVSAANAPLPKGKTESHCGSSVLHKQKGVPENQADIICQKSVPKDTSTDLPSRKAKKKEKTPADRQKHERAKKAADRQKHERTKKAAVSCGVLSSKAQTEHISGKTRVKKPGLEKGCTSKLFDSGISLGEDVSSSGCETNAICSLLPGFMEEPLQSELQVFVGDSPVSPPVSSNVSDPASSLNRSLTSEGYKRSAKRERGRYSTSKLEAWASAVNESLDEVESFQLLVE